MAGRQATENTPLLPGSGPVQETEFTAAAPGAARPTASSASSSTRQLAPDLLRGVLMALMALDHTSVAFGVYSHGTGVVSEAASTVITQWNTAIPYGLRTATHLCAGGFAMLMGMGIAYFVSSRASPSSAQGPWTPEKQMWHFSMRTVAMFLVNFVGWQLVTALSGVWLWLFNIVLIALAIDYFVVGGLYVLIAYYIEPSLQRAVRRWRGAERDSCGDEDSTSSSALASAATLAGSVIDITLLAVAAISLWVSIWTSPNQGACQVAQRLDHTPAAAHIAATQDLLLGHIVSPPARDYCKSAGSILFGFLFQQVMCIERGLMSSFPPVGWLPFVLFGVVYGRALLRLRSPAKVSALNASLSLVFALLFVSTRLFQYGNLSTNCLDTPDQHPQHAHRNQYLASFRSFFYIVKYPPSPAFAFATLSLNFLLLYVFNVLSKRPKIDALLRKDTNILLVFGNNPLFFYGTHGWYITLLSKAYMRTSLPGSTPLPPPPGTGWGDKPHIGLGYMFPLIYASLLVFMYFLCKAYGGWKKTKGRESVWRFL